METRLRKPRAIRRRMELCLELPLLLRAQEGDNAFLLTGPTSAVPELAETHCGVGPRVRPQALPGPGEQYRFHFDMTRCIGCKCCVVACNEQNGNPADILWRRVGEIEGGRYPDTRRHYLSMGCNHCLEPTCMTGCPVDAYAKDPLTGIVLHNADACIGCQYCTWNCSYGVPQYNPQRGVVGKCDMCYGRLTSGQDPACATACPEDAIRIEIVPVNEWRQQYRSKANAPGMPSADHSLSTTRITLPPGLPRDLRKVDLNNLRLEHPHWPLIVMTVLTQFSVGGFIAVWLMRAPSSDAHRMTALASLAIGLIALLASTLHLGRPIHAIRALRMWRRSWLSREVLLFTLFTASAAAYSADLWIAGRGQWVLGVLTGILGVCGIGASARLYCVPGRPAWNSPVTLLDFLATTALGACTTAIVQGATRSAAVSLWAAVLVLVVLSVGKFAWLASSQTHELHGTWQLLSTVLSVKVFMRFLLLFGGAALATVPEERWVVLVGVALIACGEFVSRYLFFVSVVPTNMPSEYLAREAA